MADGLTVDTGSTEVLARSVEAAADALRDPSDLTAQIGSRVATMATGRVPRRTGRLAGSLTVHATQWESQPATVLTWGVRYAVFVNFGTRTMRAQPFATDALAAATRDADPLLRQWSETIIDRIGA